MKNLSKYCSFFVAFLLSFSITAQDHCATTEQEQKFLEKHPEFLEESILNRQALEEFTKNFIENNQRSGYNAKNYIIPVVFHIIYENETGPENISDQRIHDQIRRINSDFNAYKADTSDVVQAFKSIIGDANIQFALAQKTPQGNPTTGIVRYQQNTPSGGFETGDMANGRQWDRSKYMNVYSVNQLGLSSAAAYTYRPGNVGSGWDAIYSNYTYINGNNSTLSHEAGHWFNLAHTWGNSNNPEISTNCNGDDGVDDTPNTIGQYGGCDVEAVTCGSLDNVQNYMNYSSCDRMFTIGQVERMVAALESSTASRNNLWTTTNLTATGVNQLYNAEFINRQVVCEGGDIPFHDISLINGKNTWNWTFEGGTPAASDERTPRVIYDNAGMYDVNLTVGNGTGNMSKNKPNNIFVLPRIGTFPPFEQGFENATNLLTEDWLVNASGTSPKSWEIDNTVGYSGTSSLKVSNYNNSAGNKTEFITQPIDLSLYSSATFEMQIAYSRIGSSLDKLELFMSRDCGETWFTLGTKSASQLSSATETASAFVPTLQSEWKKHTFLVYMSSYLVENFVLKAVFSGEGGNNIYIDDINIVGNFKQHPMLEYPLNNSDDVPATVKLDWKAVPDVDKYEYQLDVVETFDSPSLISGTKDYIAFDKTLEDTEFTAEGLIRGQTYYWRVRTIIGTSNSNWSDVWNFKVSTVSSLEDELNGKSNLVIYPNPTKDNAILNIYVEQTQTTSIKIIDMLGKVVQNIENVQLNDGINNIELNTQPLQSGVYFVVATNNNETQTIKFIKQ
jgi:PKD repeat protein